MNIGVVATRVAGVDGVTFEIAKWETILERMGHEVRLMGGEVDALRPDARLVPAMHFTYPQAARVTAAAFDPDSDADAASGISAREIVLLALATSIDALAVGLSFAFLDVPLWIAVVSIGLVTFVLSFVAVLIGHRIGTRWRKPAEIIGGIVLEAGSLRADASVRGRLDRLALDLNARG